MKCITCGRPVGDDPRDSPAQARCWQHVTGNPQERGMTLPASCRLPECGERGVSGYEGFCPQHWEFLKTWIEREATDLATGHFSVATGRQENAVRAKALARIRRRRVPKDK